MQIAQSSLNDVLGAFQTVFCTVTASAEPAGRRHADRIEQESPLVIVPLHDDIADEPVTVHLKDVSRGGLGFAARAAMPAGSQFLVRLPRAGRPALSVMCQVAHCRPAAPGTYRLGAAFVRVLGGGAESAREVLRAAA